MIPNWHLFTRSLYPSCTEAVVIRTLSSPVTGGAPGAVENVIVPVSASIEDMVEVYYNSRQFENTMKYLESKFETPYMMYEYMANYYDRQGLFDIKHNRIARYNILIDISRQLMKEEKDIDEAVLLDILSNLLK